MGLSDLAIIIPAYKSSYFNDSLSSLANQTNKNFMVYVGDDCSPEDLKTIVDQFASKLCIHYTRFPNNVGSKNIVHQWKRCVDLMADERWIWLFSDDDIADSTCVEKFYETIDSQSLHFDAYRFDTRIINEQGNLIAETAESPQIESSFDLANELLMNRRGNCMPDHIFSKKRYDELGGFVYTDYAQGADWASSILFAGTKGLYTIPGPKVNWRLSSSNISGTAKTEAGKKIMGHLQFLKWVKDHFIPFKTAGPEKYQQIETACDHNLEIVLKDHYKKLPLSVVAGIYNYYAYQTSGNKSAWKKLYRLYKYHAAVPVWLRLRNKLKKVFLVKK